MHRNSKPVVPVRPFWRQFPLQPTMMQMLVCWWYYCLLLSVSSTVTSETILALASTTHSYGLYLQYLFVVETDAVHAAAVVAGHADDDDAHVVEDVKIGFCSMQAPHCSEWGLVPTARSTITQRSSLFPCCFVSER